MKVVVATLVGAFSVIMNLRQAAAVSSQWHRCCVQVLTLSLLFRSLPKSGKLNFAPDLSINETEASDCGLDVFYEKVFTFTFTFTTLWGTHFQCMILIERLDFVGLCKEEFLILKVSSAIVYRSRFLDTLHFAFPQAVVLANSDCQLENQTAIETLKETLLSSLHDVINCVRCDYTSRCLL